MTLKNSSKNQSSQDAHWIPLADLMTGLMMVFLFISVVFMIKVQKEAEKTKNIIIVYDKTKAELLNALEKEFKDDIQKWGAEINKDLSIRFKSPSILFDTGSNELKPAFKEILNDFFPRYIAILNKNEFKSIIEEIRIEGHTSSFWSDGKSNDNAYFLNMDLSQRRTRSLLQYVLELPEIKEYKGWIKSHLTANGLSSSRLIYQIDNITEDSKASQRVEIRIKTTAESKLNEALEKNIN
ncbi:MAG: hypothetical protein RLZZ210_1228 [Pseudomonadota bacterium]|jgi:outer membrane protein OmpA-like peptidoglycan-associated protein